MINVHLWSIKQVWCLLTTKPANHCSWRDVWRHKIALGVLTSPYHTMTWRHNVIWWRHYSQCYSVTSLLILVLRQGRTLATIPVTCLPIGADFLPFPWLRGWNSYIRFTFLKLLNDINPSWKHFLRRATQFYDFFLLLSEVWSKFNDIQLFRFELARLLTNQRPSVK